ncbi:MAG: nucleotide sugar dehydrogenase [Rhodobacter sp. CACIA14H1]|nr:MAG: nucleotide sugar dehydrogenase [Rhodobacter sp. CACIA14H1]
MANIAVFGIGYVGVVSAACLARDGHRVIAVDVDPTKVAAINAGLSPIVEPGVSEIIAECVAEGRLTATTDAEHAIRETDASFVCVGTPSAPDGSISLEYVKDACRAIGSAIAAKGGYHSVILRSTIVPGTMEETCIPVLETASGRKAGTDFGVGYYPEFLRESTAVADYRDPGLIVFGALDDMTARLLTDLNGGIDCKIHVTDLRTAEMVKYTSNAWRAVKVSFANEIGNIAKSAGLDGQQVLSILTSDLKVSMSPWFMRPGFAFGGSCLPKDVRALRAFAATRRTETPLLDAVLVANAEQIARAEAMVRDAGARRVGLIGISFKPGTDDMRESPLAELASRLIGQGVAVKVWDPYVQEACDADLTSTGRGNDWGIDLKETLVPSLDDLIEGTDILLVGNRYEDAVTRLTALNGDRTVIDLARIDPKRRSGGSYHGICW